MKPTVGRVVHFVHSGQICAAIVAKVWSDECVNLTVCLPDGGTYGYTSATRDDSRVPHGTWSWPPRSE